MKSSTKFDLDFWLLATLKSLPKVKIFETYQLRETVKGESESQPKCQIQTFKVKGQGQGWAKGQIYLTGYNFASNCHRDFKLDSYFSLWKATPNMTLTLSFDLDLEKFTQGQNFETYQLRKAVKGEGESQPKFQIH